MHTFAIKNNKNKQNQQNKKKTLAGGSFKGQWQRNFV